MTKPSFVHILAGGLTFMAGAAFNQHTWKGVVAQPEVEFCQPFKTPEQSAAEAAGLAAQGYSLVLAQELFKEFKARSQGKIEILEQTNRRCFTHLGGEGKAVKEFWVKR